MLKFEDLSLAPELLQAIRNQNIETCTDIQEKAMPHALEGRDVSGLSQTGTGKTFAFLVPIIDRILKSKQKAETLSEDQQKRMYPDWRTSHFALVLAPTRELVEQISQVAKTLGEPCGIKSTTVIGGVDYDPQKQAIAGGVEIIIGTPGRLLDLYKNHVVHFKDVRAIVFDEADRMFDMGFKDDMNFILQRCPPERQILLFSATLNFDVLNTAYKYGSHPVELNISRDQAKAVDVEDELFHCGEEQKPQFLLSILKRQKPKQAIIFSNFKNQVERISNFLNANEMPAVGISSLLTQAQRDRVINQFKNENEINILVATDLAARGLDIKGVDLVINCELPDDAENYIHRIGRTGRAGAKGKAFSLVCDRDVSALSRIEDYLKQKVKIGWLEDSDLVQEFKPVPSDEYKSRSHVRKTGLAAAKDKPPFEQSLRRPRPQGRHHQNGAAGDRPHRPQRQDQQHPSRRPDQRSDHRPDLRHRTENERPDHQRSENQSAKPNSQNVHRDKRTRRHLEGPNRPQNSQQTRHSHNSQQKRPADFKRPPQKPNRTFKSNRPSSQSSAPLIAKVTGFFKKLFD